MQGGDPLTGSAGSGMATATAAATSTVTAKAAAMATPAVSPATTLAVAATVPTRGPAAPRGRRGITLRVGQRATSSRDRRRHGGQPPARRSGMPVHLCLEWGTHTAATAVVIPGRAACSRGSPRRPRTQLAHPTLGQAKTAWSRGGGAPSGTLGDSHVTCGICPQRVPLQMRVHNRLCGRQPPWLLWRPPRCPYQRLGPMAVVHRASPRSQLPCHHHQGGRHLVQALQRWRHQRRGCATL